MEELRPLSLGELIDRSVAFWRQRWRPLFVLYLGFALGGYAVIKAGNAVVHRYFPAAASFDALEATRVQGPDKLLGELVGGFAVTFASLGVYMLITSFAAVAVTRYAMLSYLGQPTGPREAIGEAAARTGKTLAMFALTAVWTVAVIALATLPGAGLITLAVFSEGAGSAALAVLGSGVAMLGALVAIVWSILRFFLTSQLVAVEDLPLWRLFVRSGQLTSGRVGPGLGGLVKARLTVLLTVMGMVILIVSLVGNIPALGLQVAYAPSLVRLDPALVPVGLLVPAELVDVVFTSVVAPLYVVFQTLVYLDMRVRREGLDLKLKLTGPAEALKAA